MMHFLKTALFLQMAMASAYANEMPPTTEVCSADDGSNCGTGDTSILIQRRVDTTKAKAAADVNDAQHVEETDPWVAPMTQYSDTMTVSVQVIIDMKIAQGGVLGAFMGSDVRGVQATPTVPPFGPYKSQPIYQITIYGEGSGGEITFKYKTSDGNELTLEGDAMTYGSNDNHGSVIAPIFLRGGFMVQASDFSDSMTITAAVKIDNKIASKGALAAFIGSDIRGVQASPTTVPFGTYQGKALFQITIYGGVLSGARGGGNAPGGQLSFKFRGKDGETVLQAAASPVSWTTNANLGSLTAPVVLTPAPPPTSPPASPPAAACTDDAAGLKIHTMQTWGQEVGCSMLKHFNYCRSNRAMMQQYCSATCEFC